MNTAIRSVVRSVEPSASRLGANARKREASDSIRRAEVRREAATHVAGWARKLTFAAVAALVLLGGAFGGREVALRQGWIALRDIEVKGFSNTSVTEIVALSGVPRGRPLTAIDLGLVRASLAGHPWIRKVSVGRSFPHRLRIAIVERIPVVALPDGRWVGEDGRVMDARGIRDLPVVAGVADDERHVALAAMPLVRAMARMSRETPRLAARIRDARLETDGSIALRLDGFAPLVRLQPDDWKRGLARAGALEKELMTESERIAEIDLRHGSCAALRRREGGA